MKKILKENCLRFVNFGRSNCVNPIELKLFRKRKCTPETWKKNVRKKLKLTGQQYVSQRGKNVNAKEMNPVN